jgi:hypothetical protein
MSFVSRAGQKLEQALVHFQIDVAGKTCADLGSNAGGFVDCLLQRGAAKVYAIDTGYGALEWKLRKDPRVVAMERTNAMHPSGRKSPSSPSTWHGRATPDSAEAAQRVLADTAPASPDQAALRSAFRTPARDGVLTEEHVSGVVKA